MSTQSFLHREISYFKRLSADGRRLVTAITIYNLTNPIVGVFITAFLWRASLNVTTIAFYALATWLADPVGFLLNSFLARRFSPSQIFGVAAFGQGLVATSLIVLKPVGVIPILFFGLINGLFTGFYWSNRNFLTLRVVDDHHQLYFYSLTSTFSTLMSVVLPPLIGWFIVFGPQINLYSSQVAYIILGLITLLIFYFASTAGQEIASTLQNPEKIWLIRPSPTWQKVRKLMFSIGLVNGLEMFLPSLLILMLVGNEKTLGTALAVTAIIAAIATYLFGRQEKADVTRIIFIGTVATALAGLSLGLFYSQLGVFLLLILNSIGNAFRWQGIVPLFYNAINRDENQTQNHHMAFIFDVEVILNIGRVVGICSFIATFFIFKDAAIRFVFPAFCLFQFVTHYFCRQANTELKNSSFSPVTTLDTTPLQ